MIKTSRLLFLGLAVLALTGSAGAEAYGTTAAPLAAELVSDAQPIDLTSARYQKLFNDLKTEHHFSQTEIDRFFSGVNIRKRVLELMDRQWEAKPYHLYYPLFITTAVIEEGRDKLRQYRDLLDRIEQELGVEREIVVAIWGIESRYGRNEGAFNVFQTLNTLFEAYPRRRDFARRQLIEFLLLCRENKIDPLTVKGSYAGAFGQTQFIPSSFREYAVNFDRDDRKDVWHSIPDILASIANYLRRYRWTLGAPIYCELGSELRDDRLLQAYDKGRKGYIPWQVVKKAQQVEMVPPPDNKDLTVVGLELADGGMRYVAGYPNFQAITAWNHSNRYAMVVTELAEAFKK